MSRFETSIKRFEFNGASVEIRQSLDDLRNGRSSKPRLYVSSSDRFDVVESLANRTRRPHTIWRDAVVDLFAKNSTGVRLTGMRWSQKAGCSMCPCSPGFILPEQHVPFFHGEKWDYVIDENGDRKFACLEADTPVSFARGFDVYVTFESIATIDESKPARLAVAW